MQLSFVVFTHTVVLSWLIPSSFLRSKVPPEPSDGTDATLPPPAPSSVVQFFSEDDTRPQRKKNMLVFVVGGISYLEIAALRFLSRDPSFPYNIIIGTTSVGSGLLKTLVHTGI